MKLDQGVRALADRVKGGAADADPYLLVLGADVARAANVPSLDELSRRVGQAVEPGDRRMIDRLLYDTPAPAFYQNVANVIREGFLPQVATTGYDSLLERTLEDAGLRAPYHYASLDVGDSRSDEGSASRAGPDTRLRIVHVHGTAAPGRLAAALGVPERGHPLRVVVVGFEFESPIVEEWLAHADAGDLWWVARDVAEDPQARLRWAGDFAAITGDGAAPNDFFGQLGLILLGLPDGTAPGDDDDPALEEQLYRTKLAQAKVYKQSIEQRVASVGSDPAAARQLDYQTQQIGELEQQLARSSASGDLERMRAFAGQLDQAAASGSANPETAAFFHSQLDTLERELTKTDPNRTIVTAAQAAMNGIVSELGPTLGRGQSSA